MTPRLRHRDYTVAWICALFSELAAAEHMLDVKHEDLPSAPNDLNIYSLGSIAGHNVIIVCLPAGQKGQTSAAVVSMQTRASFPSIRFSLLVGVGGGVPGDEDVRLGDVVVSHPLGVHPGVVQYDVGKSTPSGFTRTGSLAPPPNVLLSAVNRVRANEFLGKGRHFEHIADGEKLPRFRTGARGPDVLYAADYNHQRGSTCDFCDASRQMRREPREFGEEVKVHYGTIASGNRVMRHGIERDRISRELGGVLCFEMEAAGVLNSLPCLVVRGICNYADSHKNDRWQSFAAVTATAYAKEILSVITPEKIAEAQSRASHDMTVYRTPPGNTPVPNRSDERVPRALEGAFDQNDDLYTENSRGFPIQVTVTRNETGSANKGFERGAGNGY